MAETKIRTRNAGASAVLQGVGLTHVTTPTGGEMKVITSVNEPGFSPLDLLYASLASCLVLSARAAASRLGVLHKLEGVRADVTGEKAPDEPSRVARFHIVFAIDGPIDLPDREAIVKAAETEICTISNTLHGNPGFVTRLEE
ncbi:MAG: OsmC family protein [Phyllobacterium sp.]